MAGAVKGPSVQALIDTAHQVYRAVQYARDWSQQSVEPTFFREMTEHYAPRGHSLTLRQRQVLPQLWAYDCGDKNRIALRLTPWGLVRGIVLSSDYKYPFIDFRKRIDHSGTDVVVQFMGITPMNIFGKASLDIWDGAFGVWFNDPAFTAMRELADEIRGTFEYREALRYFEKETATLPSVQRAAEIVGGLEEALLQGNFSEVWSGILLDGGFMVHRSDDRDEESKFWYVGVPRGINASPASGVHAPIDGNFDFEFGAGKYTYEITEDGLITSKGKPIIDRDGRWLK